MYFCKIPSAFEQHSNYLKLVASVNSAHTSAFIFKSFDLALTRSPFKARIFPGIPSNYLSTRRATCYLVSVACPTGCKKLWGSEAWKWSVVYALSRCKEPSKGTIPSELKSPSQVSVGHGGWYFSRFKIDWEDISKDLNINEFAFKFALKSKNLLYQSLLYLFAFFAGITRSKLRTRKP